MRSNNEYLFLEEEQAGRLEINRTGEVYRIKQGGKKSRIDHAGSDGYRSVTMEADGKRLKCQAHRVIWYKYNGAISEGMAIHHINKIRWDNHIENLEQVNQADHADYSKTTSLSALAKRVNRAKQAAGAEVCKQVYDSMTLCKPINAV